MPSKDLSIIVPLFNESESITELCDWIINVVEEEGIDYEIIFVDDGSTDDSWEIIKSLSVSNPSIKGIRFSSNFGKSAALSSGFKACTGQVVITMDADLQDSPDEIPHLVSMIKNEEFDLVSGWKKVRNDPISKTLPSRLFNSVTRLFSGIRLHDFNCGLKAYNYKVVKNIDVYGEMHRYIPLLAKWQGFKNIGEKVVEHHPRKYGKTKFGMSRFIYGFLDLLSVTFVTKFQRRPMHLFGTFGILSFLIGFIMVATILWEKIDSIYISKIPVQREVVEQPIFFISLAALIIGILLFLTGFIAEMIAQSNHKKNDYPEAERTGFD